MKNNKKPWIMSEIKKLCQNKESLYLLSKSNSDSKFKKYYKSYCKNLTLTIKAAKRRWCNNQILTSNNKSKTIWKIIKIEPIKQNKSEDGIFFLRKIMKVCATKSLLIPLTKFFFL